MQQSMINAFYIEHLSTYEIANPYKAVYTFMRKYDLIYIRQTASEWIASVYKTGSWIVEMSDDFLYFYETLIKIMESAWLIHKMDNTTRLANLTLSYDEDEIKLMNIKLYCNPTNKIYSWEYFPRSLSRKEYINPYKVFTKFFRFHSLSKWKKQLANILYISIKDNSSISEKGIDILSVKKHLNKLIDACHLISVREFEYLDEYLAY